MQIEPISYRPTLEHVDVNADSCIYFRHEYKNYNYS
jgi:hypothetical protein